MRLTRFLALTLVLLCVGPGVRAASAAEPTKTHDCPNAPAPSATAPGPLDASRVTPDMPVSDFAVAGGRVAVMRQETNDIATYSTSGTLLSRIDVPKTDVARQSIALDDEGGIYLVRYPTSVVKYSPTGALLWERPTSNVPFAVFLQGVGPQQRIGVIVKDDPKSQLLTLEGATGGDSGVVGDRFTRGNDGSVIASQDGRYIRSFSAEGVPGTYFGAAAKDNDPMPAGAPLHRYSSGEAVRLDSGEFVVADQQRGLVVFSSDGLLLGALPSTSVDPDGVVDLAPLAVDGDRLLVATGRRFSASQRVVSVSVADVLARTAAGQWASDRRLGMGAGFTTGQPLGFAAAGTELSVTMLFDPWWRALSPRLQVCYTVRSADDLRSGTPGSAEHLEVSDAAMSVAGDPVPLPSLAPGYYQLDAVLLLDGAARTSTRVYLTQAAAEHRLNFASLPSGADAGGPEPARGVALSDVLGTGTQRSQLSWDKLLRGAGAPLDTSPYEAPYAEAGAQASSRGTTFIVQAGQGGPERALVADGTWGARIAEVVNTFKGSVHVWEAWNEPNITYGAAADYVNNVLKPFYQSVKAVDPSATVVGGSTVDVSLPYWQEIIAAGGLQWMDVAAIHPYTGHNRSFEEQGAPQQIRALKALLFRDGRPIPLWNTEQAFWSDGEANLLGQADMSSRELLWNRALGIDKWAYFISEGTWGGDVNYSVIQNGAFVKPAALALMTTSNQLRDRPYLGLVDLGLSSAYAMRFGARPGGSGDLLVAWTDGLSLPAVLSGKEPLTIVQTQELGASTVYRLAGSRSLVLGPDPVFLTTYGGSAEIALQEAFGPDLALAFGGAKAQASSSRTYNPASAAIDGDSTAAGRGDLPGLPAWGQAPGDLHPTLTVRFSGAKELDRVMVSTHSNGSVVTSLRDYDVDLQDPSSGAWTQVAQVRGQYHYRQRLISFSPRPVAALRLRSLLVNYSGYEGGAKPSWWPSDPAALADENASWYGPAVVSEIAAYAPGRQVPVTTLPAAPRAVVATAMESAVKVAWGRPQGNSVPIRSFVVRVFPGGRQVRFPGTVREGTVSGLTNGRAYTFTVSAVNAVGAGPASARSNTVVPAGRPKPSTVAIARITAASGGVRVSWQPADDSGNTVTGYAVTAAPGGRRVVVSGSTTNAYFWSLPPGRPSPSLLRLPTTTGRVTGARPATRCSWRHLADHGPEGAFALVILGTNGLRANKQTLESVACECCGSITADAIRRTGVANARWPRVALTSPWPFLRRGPRSVQRSA